MSKTRIEELLAYFAASFAAVSALGGSFILGIAFITAGQRAAYAAGVACISSSFVLLIIAAILFRKLRTAQRVAGITLAKA